MAELLKDLYNRDYIHVISNELNGVYSQFDAENFRAGIFDAAWESRELKQRMRHIAVMLYDSLPKNYNQAIEILKIVFSKLPQNYGLENMIFQDFVEVYGMDDFTASMQALEHFTIHSSSEFAVRQFIVKHEDDTMRQMQLWACSQNEHIRRLASEGCRPRLPWAIALDGFKKDPSKVIEILEVLKDDESEYVRKSVANNLNDISKDNPERVKEIAVRWMGVNKNRDWILKHGCRTLLKEGDRDILNLFGFTNTKNITIKNVIIPSSVKMGDALEFSFVLHSNESLGKLRVEYALTFARQNNRLSTKVFKISEFTCKTKSKEFSKKYSFKPITTRKYYRGNHKLAIIVNGNILIEQDFTVS